MGIRLFLLYTSSFLILNFLNHSLYLHTPYQCKHKHQYNFLGAFSSPFVIFYKHIMLVKLLKIKDFHCFTLCINAIVSTWNEWTPSMSSIWVVCGNISTKLFNDSLRLSLKGITSANWNLPLFKELTHQLLFYFAL